MGETDLTCSRWAKNRACRAMLVEYFAQDARNRRGTASSRRGPRETRTTLNCELINPTELFTRRSLLPTDLRWSTSVGPQIRAVAPTSGESCSRRRVIQKRDSLNSCIQSCHNHFRRARRSPAPGQDADGRRHHRPVPDPGRHPARQPVGPRRAGPRKDRQRQDARLLHPARRPPRRRCTRRRRSPPWPDPGPDPRARHPDHRRGAADGPGPRPDRDHHLRWRPPGSPGVCTARRCRHRRGLPRSSRRPHAPAPRASGPRRDLHPRRGRPHGRPRLPARRHPHPDRHPRRRPATAVLGDARQRCRQAGQALPQPAGHALGRRGHLTGLGDDPPHL